MILDVVIWAGIEFQMDAPEKEKLVLKRSVLGLGKIIVRDEERLFEQTKKKGGGGAEILRRKIYACFEY